MESILHFISIGTNTHEVGTTRGDLWGTTESIGFQSKLKCEERLKKGVIHWTCHQGWGRGRGVRCCCSKLAPPAQRERVMADRDDYIWLHSCKPRPRLTRSALTRFLALLLRGLAHALIWQTYATKRGPKPPAEHGGHPCICFLWLRLETEHPYVLLYGLLYESMREEGWWVCKC